MCVNIYLATRYPNMARTVGTKLGCEFVRTSLHSKISNIKRKLKRESFTSSSGTWFHFPLHSSSLNLTKFLTMLRKNPALRDRISIVFQLIAKTYAKSQPVSFTCPRSLRGIRNTSFGKTYIVSSVFLAPSRYTA